VATNPDLDRRKVEHRMGIVGVVVVVLIVLFVLGYFGRGRFRG
jgi:hypothetical protein